MDVPGPIHVSETQRTRTCVVLTPLGAPSALQLPGSTLTTMTSQLLCGASMVNE